MGSISIRKHIRWGAGPPAEPTSTLVLTSPGRRFFVDVRVLTAASPSLGSVTGPDNESAGSLPRDSLDWAFAGTSSTTKTFGPDGSDTTHSVFNHWVDSRTTEPQLVRDEGDMTAHAGGLALEVGNMVNPATGRMTAYEELWSDEVPVRAGAQNPSCVVFQLSDEPGSKRGQFILLGRYAQGVLRVGDTFTAERWVWNEEHGRWKQTVKVGDNSEPLGFLVDGRHRPDKAGDNVEGSAGTWTVVEYCQ
ncbi:hypothetical protein DHEL01_v208624 [Diaporthe helianthi]|uniref:Protein HRI1 n=1 Tax=Diaporthe helianthi TaxID=158607 RepID=A0A2P5HRX6_DIAHE|nr:hypothetical protein DHEL01_v208624 [Diaporthe helianthi]